MEAQQLNGSTGVKKKYNKKPLVIEDKAQPPQQDILETQPKVKIALREPSISM